MTKKANNRSLNRRTIEELAQRPQGVTWYEMAERRGYDLTRSSVYRVSFESAIRYSKGGLVYQTLKNGVPVHRNGQPVLIVTEAYRAKLEKKRKAKYDTAKIINKMRQSKMVKAVDTKAKKETPLSTPTITVASQDATFTVTSLGGCNEELKPVQTRKKTMEQKIADLLDAVASLLTP